MIEVLAENEDGDVLYQEEQKLFLLREERVLKIDVPLDSLLARGYWNEPSDEAKTRANALKRKFNPNHAPPGGSDGGQFTSDGAGGGASGGTASDPAADHTASDKERKASLKQARKKIADAPVPTKEEVAKARADLANAARAGGDSRGGSAASRRAQRENLFQEFGGEAKGYVVCPWTGLKMHWTDDKTANPNGYPKFERGKIFTKVQGGGYRLPNLIPESFTANRSRNDKPIRRENLR